MSDPTVAGLNSRIQHLLTWLRIIADEAERSRRPRIALLAAMASAGEPPTRDPKGGRPPHHRLFAGLRRPRNAGLGKGRKA